MTRQSKGILWGIFLLRFGLGIYLLLSALGKIMSPKTSVAYFSQYYFLSVPSSIIIMLGALELALSLMFLLGMYRNWTYGIALLIQCIATLVVFEKLLVSFSNHSYFLTLFPILFAFIALFVMRHHDTKWTLTKKPGMFS